MTLGDGWRRRPGAPPLVFGHRGVRGPLPENTLAAFARARDEGADAIELDVRLARDGVIVVAHDPDLARVTRGRDRRAIAEMSSGELSRVDVGDGQGVPTLAETLALAAARGLRVNVELKRDVPSRRALVRAVVDLVRDVRDGERSVMLSTFDPAMMLELRARARGLLVALIVHAGQRRYRPFLVARALGVGALHPERLLVASGETLARARARGLVVNVWTVNDEREASDLAALGVDGLITDRPALVGAAVRGLRHVLAVVFWAAR